MNHYPNIRKDILFLLKAICEQRGLNPVPHIVSVLSEINTLIMYSPAYFKEGKPYGDTLLDMVDEVISGVEEGITELRQESKEAPLSPEITDKLKKMGVEI